MRTRKGSERKPQQRWHERTADKDIRYRGPLNYQHFQILGWLCIAATQLVLILGLANKMNMLPDRYAGLQEPARIMSWLALPFLLIANFAQIMNGKKSYKSLLIKNFCAAAAIWAGYAFILHRYIVGTVDVINDGTVSSLDVVTRFMIMLTSSGLLKIGSPGVLAFNVFVDLFLCTLLMFFLNYRPKKIFTGKWRYVFRSFALLPIAYEVGCIVLKVMASRFQIEVSPYLYPLFTVKPTMTFVLFIVLAFYIKTREWRFCRHGRTHEEYAAFLHTRKNSWDFCCRKYHSCCSGHGIRRFHHAVASGAAGFAVLLYAGTAESGDGNDDPGRRGRNHCSALSGSRSPGAADAEYSQNEPGRIRYRRDC